MKGTTMVRTPSYRFRPALLFVGLALLGLLATACAAPTAMTTWGYSSWSERFGGGEMGGFEKARAHCLERLGITDPASVVPESAEETGFLACMNAENWCTNRWGCSKPGV
jgi:hypothetical protein